MKAKRQGEILDIIAQQEIETQEQLLEALQTKGLKSTQATISRDIRELHLVKELTAQGTHKYTVSEQRVNSNFADRLHTIFKEGVLSYDQAQNIVVLSTMPGLASAACAAVDSMDIPYLVGSLAGDDTAILIMRDNQKAEDFCEEIRKMLK